MIDTKKDIHTISTTSPHSGTAATEGRVARPDAVTFIFIGDFLLSVGEYNGLRLK